MTAEHCLYTTRLPAPGETVVLAGDQGKVVSIGKPLASGRFAGMHVVVCVWQSTGREGTFIAETHRYTIL